MILRLFYLPFPHGVLLLFAFALQAYFKIDLWEISPLNLLERLRWGKRREGLLAKLLRGGGLLLFALLEVVLISAGYALHPYLGTTLGVFFLTPLFEPPSASLWRQEGLPYSPRRVSAPTLSRLEALSLGSTLPFLSLLTLGLFPTILFTLLCHETTGTSILWVRRVRAVILALPLLLTYLLYQLPREEEKGEIWKNYSEHFLQLFALPTRERGRGN